MTVNISGLFLLLSCVYNGFGMKNKHLKIAIISTVFAFSCGLSVHQFNKIVEKVEAAQFIDNFDSYSYSGTYYNSTDLTGTEGLNGTLRNALTTLIHPTKWYQYGGLGDDNLSTQLQRADEDPTNSSNMIYLYTRDSVKKNNSISGSGSWNREHVWPQSLSGGYWGTSEAGTDLLHIRPTYETTNGTRSSLLYGDVNKSNPLTFSGMTYGYKSGNYFEPLDSVKGDVARIIMYVWTAYKNSYANLPAITSTFQSYDILLKWHTMDKPDVMEGHRNDYSQSSKQGNRNPFVDHPEFAWKIFGNSASSSIKNECMAAYPDGGSVLPGKTLESISLSGSATKKAYYVGESFDPTGLTVTAHYDDNSTKNISVNNCTWSPNPLTEGTTTVTCTYSGKTATYSGITVTKNENAGTEFKVDFVAIGSDSGNRLSGEEVFSNYLKNNSLVKSVDETSNVFAGKSGLKLGSSSTNGSITFSLKAECCTNIEYIKVDSTRFSSDSGRLAIKLGSTTITSSAVPGQSFTQVLSDINATTLTISTDSKRAYLNGVLIKTKADSPVVPPVTSSSMPSSSSNAGSSIAPVSSSSETSSAVSSNAESSSAVESSGAESSSFFEESSSINTISSSQETVTSLESSSNPQNTSSNSGSKKSTGCTGSIAIVPLTGLSTLIGLVFIFSKKKK